MHFVFLLVGLGAAQSIDPTLERILDDHDVPETDRDSTQADNLIDDELRLRERRALRESGERKLNASDLPPAVPRRRWHWTRFLPRIVFATRLDKTPTRQDIGALAYAEFSLGRTSPSPTPDEDPSRARLALATPPGAAAPGLDHDAEAPCLSQARTRAVARAFAEPERALSYLSRAARAAWLPELRLRVERRVGRDESLDLPAGTTTVLPPLGLDTSEGVRYEARATWDLSQLIFSPAELAAEAHALRMAGMRQDLESLANQLYFERRRLIAKSQQDDAGAGDTPEAALAARRILVIRIQELEADLDVLSGGTFSQCISSQARVP
jgi:hypothetical protein